MQKGLLVGMGAFLLSACASEEATDWPAPPAEPVRLAPGVISTDAVEFALTADPDGKTFYYNRVVDGVMHIHAATRDGQSWHDGWEDAGTLAFSDPRYNDIDPFVSRDGTRLWFSSNRPRPGSDGAEAIEDYDVWYAEREGDGWGVPVHAGGQLNTPDAEVFITEDENGDIVVTRFGGADGRTPSLIMSARDALDAPAEFIETRPSGLRLTNPSISQSGDFLLMAGTSGDISAPRLYVSKRENGGWGAFASLPGVDRDGAEFAPALGNDDSLLFFTAEWVDESGEANRDIYVAAMPPLTD